jgi:Heterokaryon incompatibility protein (HET)
MEDRSTCSERTLATLKWWLSNCENNHKSCEQTSAVGQPWFPTRVIDVDSEPRLIVKGASTHPGMSQRYVTLSHCWGTKPITTLTKSNLVAFQRAIMMDSLPKTFREAILVTRKLGFRYLWIDSLCIIQDSEDDWRAESSVMGQVYKGSTLTIAALDSTDSSGGLFRQRDMIQLQPYSTSLRTSQTGEREDIYIFSDAVLGARFEINSGPLSRRAWVLQERLLSPRTVYFGSNQVFWECSELEATEAFPHGHVWGSALSNWNYLKSKLPSPNNPGGDLYLSWDSVVRTYASAQLTRKTDKLIALSAVAKEYAVALGDVYVAGLWRADLLRQLCWETGVHSSSDQDQSEQSPSPYQAPSWSWASLNSAVRNSVLSCNRPFGNYGKRVFTIDGKAEILDVCITAAGEDPTGQISRGVITIRGPVVHGILHLSSLPDLRRDDILFCSISEPQIDHKLAASIVWDGSPKYGTALTFLKILLHEALKTYALVLEAVDHQTYVRVGLWQAALEDEPSEFGLFRNPQMETLKIE